MYQFLTLLRQVHDYFTLKEDCTGTWSLNLFSYQMRINLVQNFSLVTTKKLHLRSIIHELLFHGGSGGGCVLSSYYRKAA